MKSVGLNSSCELVVKSSCLYVNSLRLWGLLGDRLGMPGDDAECALCIYGG